MSYDHKYSGENLAPRVLLFRFIQPLCYLMSLALNKANVFPV